MSPAPQEPGETEERQARQRGDDEEPEHVVNVCDAAAAHCVGREQVAEQAKEQKRCSRSGGGGPYAPEVWSGCWGVGGGHVGSRVVGRTPSSTAGVFFKSATMADSS